MSITIASRRKKIEILNKEYPGFEIIDATSKGVDPWIKFSPFYPHGDITIPFSEGVSQSVEGIWQALKVFETSDIDAKKLSIINMKGIKRTVRKNGRVLGHRAGLNGDTLLPYVEARKRIFIPTYHWILENKLKQEVILLEEKSKAGLVLLDYETNGDVNNTRKPLSHAFLIKDYLEKRMNTYEENKNERN